MRRELILLLSFFLCFHSNAFGQANERENGRLYAQEGKLDKAKKSIDNACEHETTKLDPLTWKNRAFVYLKIAQTKDDNYKKLSKDPLNEAYQAIKKSYNLDKAKKVQYKNNIILNEIIIEYYARSWDFFNKGINSKDTNIFRKGLNGYKKCWAGYDMLQENNAYQQIQSLKDYVNKNSKMADVHFKTAYCAQQVKEVDVAKKHYASSVVMNGDVKKAIDEGSSKFAYMNYAIFLSGEGLFFDAVKVMERAKELWPNDKMVANRWMAIYLDAGKVNELAKKLEEEILQDPTNISMQESYAITLKDITNKFYKDGKKQEANEYLIKTEKAFKEAIKITKEYRHKVRYYIDGTATSYEVSYIDENGTQKDEKGVINGWEYSFNAKVGGKAFLSVKNFDKKEKADITGKIFFAGSIIQEKTAKGKKASVKLKEVTITDKMYNANNSLGTLHYEYAILYFNPAVGLYNESIRMDEGEKKDKITKEYKELMKKAIPHLEESKKIDPTYKPTYQILMKAYSLGTGDSEKANAIFTELKALKNKK